MDGRTYYMRLIAVNINKHTKRSTNKMNYSNNLLVKIVLQCNGKVIAQMPELTPTQTVQNTITLLNASLDLTLQAEPSLGNWELFVMGRECSSVDNKNQRFDLSEAQSSGRKELKKIGQCEIDPYIYSDVFEQSQKSKFQENISISKMLSLDYEVYIHKSLAALEEMLMKDREDLEEPVDTAFKKRPGGSKKIRYVELNQNRETSMNSSEFSITKKPQINALKKSGAKFVPIKRENIDVIKVEMIRPREYHQQRKIKPLPYQQGAKRNDRIKSDRSTVQQSVILIEEPKDKKKGPVSEPSKYTLWTRIFTLLVMIIVAGYMMFPRKKV